MKHDQSTDQESHKQKTEGGYIRDNPDLPSQGRKQGGFCGPTNSDTPWRNASTRRSSSNSKMAGAIWFLTGALFGATAAYVFDSERGRRRRATLIDKVGKYVRDSLDAVEGQAENLINRSKGLILQVDKMLHTEPRPSDDLLTKRLRSKMGRYVTHSRSIEISVDGGEVNLRGPILTREVDDFVSMVKRENGVTRVFNDLDVYPSSDHIPGLQGEGKEYLKH